jgi:transposase-like protein
MSQIVCPSCQSKNTRRIQNELARLEKPVFSQGPEWLGYCYDCGCLYDYYEDKIINVPQVLQKRREGMNCPKCRSEKYYLHPHGYKSMPFEQPTHWHCHKCGHEEKIGGEL